MTTQTNIFERAAREKTRFPYKGMCTAEDLWDLSVQRLDRIFQLLNVELKTEREESLLDSDDRTSSKTGLQVEIIRHIVSVKLAEAAAAETREVRRQQNAMIDGILAGKQEAKLMDMSEAELLRLRASDATPDRVVE